MSFVIESSLSQAGSSRIYQRGHWNNERVLKCVYTELDQDWFDFIKISKKLTEVQIKHPQILKIDSNEKFMLIEDLGSTRFRDYIDCQPKVYAALNLWQKALAYSSKPAWLDREFDLAHLQWETQYALDGLKILGFDINESKIQPELLDLAQNVLQHKQIVCHRDCQSENIMIHNGDIFWIDYQGARWGSVYYDWASLYWDPYTRISETSDPPFSELSFYEASCQRLMQALGAYIKLSETDGKVEYKKYIPIALNRLNIVLEKLNYPMTKNLVLDIVTKYKNV
jgi:aminoglycoside/choline kinase family phosphotransferase